MRWRVLPFLSVWSLMGLVACQELPQAKSPQAATRVEGPCARRVIVSLSRQVIPPEVLSAKGVAAQRIRQNTDREWIYLVQFSDCREWETVLQTLRRDPIQQIAPDHLQKIWNDAVKQK